MFLRRAAPALARRAVFRQPVVSRSFTTTVQRFEAHPPQGTPATGESSKHLKTFEEITSEHDLLAPGAEPGTVPTDLEQSTGLERLEILGKMQGVDIFDMRPLPSDRLGTLKDPVMVHSFGDEQYIGCTGVPADSHNLNWLTVTRDRPVERCPECGSAYMMEYVGPQDDGHGHDDHHAHDDGSHPYDGEAKTMADFVRPEYR